MKTAVDDDAFLVPDVREVVRLEHGSCANPVGAATPRSAVRSIRSPSKPRMAGQRPPRRGMQSSRQFANAVLGLGEVVFDYLKET